MFALFGTTSSNTGNLFETPTIGFAENAVIIGQTAKVISLNQQRLDIARAALKIQRANKENNEKSYELSLKTSEDNSKLNKLLIELLQQLNEKDNIIISQNEEIIKLLREKAIGGD